MRLWHHYDFVEYDENFDEFWKNRYGALREIPLDRGPRGATPGNGDPASGWRDAKVEHKHSFAPDASPEPLPSIRISCCARRRLNPCPCGYFRDLKRECRCGSTQVHWYRQRTSGPLLDRIDLHIEVPAVEYRDISSMLGLEPFARFWKIHLPIASRTILAGIKTSAVINIGTATLAALIGAGGLGEPILSGLNLNDHGTILQGAIPEFREE